MSEDTQDGSGPPRRTFLQAVGALIAGALAGLAPIAAGAAMLLDPLRRTKSDTGMVMVTKLAVLPETAVPKKVTVSADRVDAWTTYRATPVGAVYLRRTDSGISALNVVCPHAGCFVNLAPDGSHFACPCHRSAFDLDGVRLDGPAPRNMDTLQVEVRNDDEVWIHFQNFRPGTEDKIPI